MDSLIESLLSVRLGFFPFALLLAAALYGGNRFFAARKRKRSGG